MYLVLTFSTLSTTGNLANSRSSPLKAQTSTSLTRWFGETHARELAGIDTAQPLETNLPATPPVATGSMYVKPPNPALDRVHAPVPVHIQTSALYSSPFNPVVNKPPSIPSNISAGSMNSPKTKSVITTLKTASAPIPASSSPPPDGVISPVDPIDHMKSECHCAFSNSYRSGDRHAWTR